MSADCRGAESAGCFVGGVAVGEGRKVGEAEKAAGGGAGG